MLDSWITSNERVFLFLYRAIKTLPRVLLQQRQACDGAKETHNVDCRDSKHDRDVLGEHIVLSSNDGTA
jgi:hypothetical protein